MDTKQKATLIQQFTVDYYSEPDYSDYFDLHDIGVPLAIGIANDLCTLQEQGIIMFEKTWADMCEIFKCDPDGEYENMEDMYYS